MKAVIGRARENRATVELELLSSTSHEVCELWNGSGVVRSMGEPQIREIIYLEPEPGSDDDTDTLGLFTFERAKNEGVKGGLFRHSKFTHYISAFPRCLLISNRKMR